MRNTYGLTILVLAIAAISVRSSVVHADLPSILLHSVTSTGSIVRCSSSRLVTASYVRMHEPDVLIEMAEKAKSDRKSMTELEHVAGNSFTNLLESTDLQQVNAASGNQGRTEWRSLDSIVHAPNLQVYPIPVSEYGPSSIDCGNLVLGTTVFRTINIICPANSTVTASPGNSYGGSLQVTELTSFTGACITPHLEPAGGIVETVDQQVDGRLSLSAQAGQDISVAIKIASINASYVDSAINVTGISGVRTWTVSVPVKADCTVTGPLNMVIAEPQPRDVSVIEGDTINIPVELVNLTGQSASVTLTVTNLPVAVTANPVTVDVPGNQTTTTTLSFTAEADPQGADPVGANLDLVVSAPGLTSSHNGMSVTVYDTVQEFSCGTVGTSQVAVQNTTVGVQADGGWYMTGTMWGVIQKNDYLLIGFDIPGDNNIGHGYWQYLGAGEETVSMSGTSQWIHDNYIDLVSNPSMEPETFGNYLREPGSQDPVTGLMDELQVIGTVLSVVAL